MQMRVLTAIVLMAHYPSYLIKYTVKLLNNKHIIIYVVEVVLISEVG